MLKIEDIMTRQVLTVAPDDSLEEAALEMTLRGVHGAPVRDEAGRTLGILSTSNLVDPMQREGLRSVLAVEDAMTPVLFAALASDHAMYAVERMVETGTHRLVVFDDAGKLAGIVTPMDVMKALLAGHDPNAGWAEWRVNNKR